MFFHLLSISAVAPADSSGVPDAIHQQIWTAEVSRLTAAQIFSVSERPAIAQTPETESEEGAPSLQPEPATPDQPPFRPQQVPLLRVFEVSPSITFLTPSAYGKSWGNASVGFGFQARNRFSDTSDGVLGLGIGFGDAEESVGVDVGVTSVSTLRRTPFTAGTVSAKVHRRVNSDLSVAVGVQNLVRWGFNDSVLSPYGVVTQRFKLRETTQTALSQVYLSAGLGSGLFEMDADDRLETVNAFGSVAVRVLQPVNVIAEWSGQDLTMGFSWTPFQNVPLVIAPGVTDITGNAGDGARFVLGVGYGINF